MRAFLLLALLALVSAEVVSLDKANFNEYVHNKQPVLVKFFAPWCGHCKRLAPIYIDLAKAAEEKIPHLTVAEVDCTKDGELCHHVQGYPTVILYHDNAQDEYEGPRTVDAFLDFLNQKL